MENGEELLYEKILRDMSEGVMVIRQGAIRFVNAAATGIFGRTAEELAGCPFVQAFLEYEENDAFNQAILDAIYDDSMVHENIVPYFDGRQMRHLHIKASFLSGGGETGVIVVLDDVSELMRLQDAMLSLEEVRELNRRLEERNRALQASRDAYRTEAETDKLTALFNKAATEKHARRRVEALREGEQAALYVLDLDHFKEANDTYGHACGDIVLQQFAAALKALFRKEDCVGRFGGDEFVVLMSGGEGDAIVRRKAEDILRAARSVAIEGKDIHITASIGIAMAPQDGSSYETLFQAADAALYRVKEQGRDGYSIGPGGVVCRTD